MSFRRPRRAVPLLATAAVLGSLAAASLAAVAPAVAQSPAPGSTITVVATEYRFEGLPESIPAGTSLTLVNQGNEIHQLLVARRNDGVKTSWDKLLTLPEDQAMSRITVLEPLFAAPGETAPGSIVVDRPGDWIAVDFVPQGLTALGDPAATLDPALASAPTHAALGMRQAFRVTKPGTTPGPLPQPDASGAPAASGQPTTSGEPAASGAPAAARTIALELDAALQILQDGSPVKEIAVTPGETITFQVSNTAGYAHNLYIGTDAQLTAAQNDQMIGIPDFNEGTQELTWTVPDDVTALKFGCTVPGHYTLMQGTFTTGG